MEAKEIKNPYLRVILEKLCSYVNVKYEDIDFNKDNWFWDYEYTKKESEEFIEWLIDYMKGNKSVRKGLMTYPLKTLVKNFVIQFEANYGWKIKD
jgi:hypothetical protein